MEGLLDTLLKLIEPWSKIFPKAPSAFRAKGLCIALLITLGRRLFSRAISVIGKDQEDWSAFYKLFSRCRWSPCGLFRPILRESLKLVDDDFVAVAYDDTQLKKTGRRIKDTGWLRDALSPKFCNNFVWGMRDLQASILLPLYKSSVPRPCRAIPVQFTQIPKFKKPRKKASEEEWKQYFELVKTRNITTAFLSQIRYLKNEMTLASDHRRLMVTVDASFVNKRCFLEKPAAVTLIGRTRKNSRLHFRSKKRGRRFYDEKSFTAEELRRDENFPYKTTACFYAGEYRKVRYKEFCEVYWKWGTKRKPLRLIIIAPTPYRRSPKGRREYRDPAYILTDDFETPVEVLIQKYFDRWQIEVNFAEEKGQLSLGKQQTWSPRSVSRTTAFVVACYAALLLAGVLHFSDWRDHPSFEKQAKWRKDQDRRPSFQDYLTVLRKEVLENPEFVEENLGFKVDKIGLIVKAAA